VAILDESSNPPREPADDGLRPGRLRWMEWAAIVGFWTILAALNSANRLLDHDRVADGGAAVTVLFAFFQAYLWAAVTGGVFWLTVRPGLDHAHRAVRFATFAAVGFAVAALMSLAGDWFWIDILGRQRRGPAPSLLRSIFRPWFVNDLVIYTGVLAAGFARGYLLRYRVRQAEAVRLERQAAELRAQLSEARLDALRMQINPHFLFNTLHAISSLVERDPRGVRRMIARLSELLRHTLNGSSEPEVALEQELDLLQKYLDIIRVRFQDNIEIELDAGPGTAAALVPNLLLQPLVENAVKHGVSHHVGAGRIEVEARHRGERLVLAVRDNGPGPRAPAAPEESTGTGLRNVRARLEQLYGDEQYLLLRTAPGGGAEVEVSLPYHTREELRAGELPPPLAAAHER
jgi:two-component sensor histidine kinase